MAMSPERPLDPKTVEACHREYRVMLERYAWAILRDEGLAGDAVQGAFVALARYAGDVVPEARRAWLFKVVYREALRIRADQQKYPTMSTDSVKESLVRYQLNPLSKLALEEEVEALKQKMKTLPKEQYEVLKLRMDDDLTFGEIAEKLSIPIGTALSRMRLALARLKDGES